MTEAAKMRMERIERLLSELEYEIVRGVMEHEIEPDIHMSKVFHVPGAAKISHGLMCMFHPRREWILQDKAKCCRVCALWMEAPHDPPTR